jgi:hypothetical protein
MKTSYISAVAVAAALTFSAPLPAAAQGWDDNYWSDYDRGVWGSDNWGEDNYGFYDNDFNWTTDDDWFKNESERSSYDFGGYDDAGDGGWFDV